MDNPSTTPPSPDASFARGGDTTELRGECPAHIVKVLDAVAIARGKTRMAIANEVLGAWADKMIHEATLVHRVLRSNPTVPEGAGAQA